MVFIDYVMKSIQAVLHLLYLQGIGNTAGPYKWAELMNNVDLPCYLDCVDLHNFFPLKNSETYTTQRFMQKS